MTNQIRTGTFVEIEYTKWPHRKHYSYGMRTLGEDSHGVWGCCEIGDQVQKAGAPSFVRSTPLLFLIPRTGCWSATWYPPSEEQLEVYIDINTEPTWTGNTVSMTDLDFDVLRHRNGAVELLEASEFDDHRLAYDYPPHLVAFARRAAASTLALAQVPAEPFDRAWRAGYTGVHGLRA